VICLEVPPHRAVRVDPDDVDAVLPIVRPLLARTVRYTAGIESVEALVESLRQGWRQWQLWVVFRHDQAVGAVVVTMETLAPGDRLATFELVAGVDAQAWIGDLFGPFERYMAQMWGVTATRVVGRRGWERFLAGQGFTPSHFITTRRIVEPLRLEPPVAALGAPVAPCITSTP